MSALPERPERPEIIVSRILPSKIEEGKLEFYAKNPELIIESRTRVACICAACLKEVSITDDCLKPSTFSRMYAHYDYPDPEACPNCGTRGSYEDTSSYRRLQHPIEHVRVKRTEHVLSRRTVGWWPFRRTVETTVVHDQIMEVTYSERVKGVSKCFTIGLVLDN